LEQAEGIGRRRRRRHSAAFKAESVAACRQAGVSIAAVALSRSLNANLLRRWVVEAERAGTMPVAVSAASEQSTSSASGSGFLPVAISGAAPSQAMIRIEVRRGSSTVSVEWPVSAARECALLLRELVR
jgi:transposase-like protein